MFAVVWLAGAGRARWDGYDKLSKLQVCVPLESGMRTRTETEEPSEKVCSQTEDKGIPSDCVRIRESI